MSYNAIFTVSFKEYCQINNLTEAPENMVKEWRESVIHNYSKESPAKFVMSLFKIPKEHKNAIEYHEYEIEETGYDIDNNEKILNVYMCLNIKR